MSTHLHKQAMHRYNIGSIILSNARKHLKYAGHNILLAKNATVNH